MEASDDWKQNVSYPATKIELIDAAVDAGAAQDVVERLQRLSQEQYESWDDVEQELRSG